MTGSRTADDSFDRDRSRRGEKHGRDNDSRDRSPAKFRRGGGHNERRVFVSNIPYEFRWQELKDLFRNEVGEVAYVELFLDDSEKSKGCGIVEFESEESARKAVEKMHRYELKGRKIVVKEDTAAEREIKSFKNLNSNRSGPPDSGRNSNISRWEQNSSAGPPPKCNNTYGLSPAFLDSLGISGPLISKVFVANLDYKVDEKKLKEVFKLAGRITNVDLIIDKEGKSRGFGTVEYEHPVEAVQAISMLHNQILYDRRINVRMDKSNERSDGPPRLPDGLKSIGMGLGVNGTALTDVSRNLPSLNLSNVQPANPLAAATSSPTSALAAIGTAALASLGQNQLGGLGSSLDRSLLDTAIARRQLEMVVNNQLSGGTSDLGLRASSLSNSFSSSMMSNNVPNSGGSSYLQSQVVGSGGGLPSYSNNSASYSSNSAPFSSSSAPFSSSSAPFSSSSASFSSHTGGLGSTRDYDPISSLGGVGSSGTGSGVPPSTSTYNEYDYRGASSMDGGRSLNRMSDTVLVGNLPSSTTWKVLSDKFRDYGEIKYCEMKSVDTGIVRFSTEREAERAISLLDRTRMDGRVIDVSLY